MGQPRGFANNFRTTIHTITAATRAAMAATVTAPATRMIAQNKASTKRPTATDRPINRRTFDAHSCPVVPAPGLRAYRRLHRRGG